MAGREWGERWQHEMYDAARRALPAPVMRHIEQGAHEGITAARALDSWAQIPLSPRVLRDVSEVDLSTNLLGTGFETPIGIAPTSMQHLCDPDGEVAMARAAAVTGTLLVVPTNAGSRFEDIAETGVTWWLQTYLTADRSIIEQVVRRAVAAGAQAIVLTVDTPVVSTRFGAHAPDWADVAEPAVRTNFERGRDRTEPGAAHAQDVTVADIAWLVEISGLPVVVKGVLRPDDARRAVQFGASAVWVSNHGGRQLDRSLSTAAALGSVISALGSAAEVYVDGGIRSGLDVLSALALGAKGVFLGRVPVFALAAGGSDAVRSALTLLRVELEEAMKLAGCICPADARSVVSTTPPGR